MKCLLSREEFKEQVFARDKHKCVLCGKEAVDAHHIMDRKLFDDGGYYLDNGASVCSDCHIDVEENLILPSKLREICNITNIILPSNLDSSKEYDKWGNEVVEKLYDENWYKRFKKKKI
jgi:hypothetical protein